VFVSLLVRIFSQSISRQWPLKLAKSGSQIEYCRAIITRKIEATIITLKKSIPRSDKGERAMKSAMPPCPLENPRKQFSIGAT